MKVTIEDIFKLCSKRACNVCPFHERPMFVMDGICVLAVEPWKWDINYIEEAMND